MHFQSTRKSQGRYDSVERPDKNKTVASSAHKMRTEEHISEKLASPASLQDKVCRTDDNVLR